MNAYMYVHMTTRIHIPSCAHARMRAHTHTHTHARMHTQVATCTNCVALQELGLGTQEEVPPINGFSIQCRVTSEDAAQNFQVLGRVRCGSRNGQNGRGTMRPARAMCSQEVLRLPCAWPCRPSDGPDAGCLSDC